MSVKIENLEGLRRRLVVEISAEEIEKAYQERLKKIAKTTKLPGFRPGKADPKILEKRYGKEILQEVGNELMQSNVRNAIIEEKVQIAGTPQVEPFEAERNKTLKIVVNYETYPEIELKDMKGVQVERVTAEIMKEDVDKVLEGLRQQNAHWKEVDRPAKEHDRVIVDFEGTIDGEPFEQNAAKDFQMELGAKRMIPGFEEGVEGMKPGEERDINVTFPKEYPSQDLAGKEAVFKIKVHKVLESELPELDDAFAEKLGFKEGGLDKLKAEVRKSMERELDRALSARLKMEVLDKLVELNPIEVPEALVSTEIDHLQQLTRQQLAQSQSKEQADNVELPREPYIEQAKKRVILGLLLGEVIKQQAIKADPDQVRAKVEEIASTYQKPEEVVAWYYNNKRMLSEVESAVLEDQTVAKLLEQLEVNEKKISYEEAVSQQPQQ